MHYIHMKEELNFYFRFELDQFDYFWENWADCESPLESDFLDEGIEFKMVMILQDFLYSIRGKKGLKTRRQSTKKVL